MSATEVLPHTLKILEVHELGENFIFRKPAETFPEPPLDLNEFETPLPEKKRVTGVRRKTTSKIIEVDKRSYTGKKKKKKPVPENRETGVSEKSPSFESRFNEGMRLFRRKRYEQAIEIGDGLVEEKNDFAAAYILKAACLINTQALDASKEVLQHALEVNRLCLEAHLMLGLIAKNAMSDQEAIRKFKEALYINPDCWPAHFYLAGIYRATGQNKKALRECRNLMRIVEQGKYHDQDLIYFNTLFTPEQLGHWCRRTLEKIGPTDENIAG